MEWWYRYSQREQRVLLAGGVFVALWLVYMLLVDPLVQFYQQERQALEDNRELVVWMRQAVADYRAAGGREAAAPSGSVAVAVEQVLRQSGLPEATRIEPQGRNSVTVNFDSVPFDRLMHTLDTLEQEQGMVVRQVRVSRLQGEGSTGMAKVELQLERSAS
ncbi:MAG: type II secretion system protein GspM [Pseudomonadota bacterium]